MLKFHSLFELEGADAGMAALLELAGMQEVKVDDADIIVFNGGADIGTRIYHERPISPGIPFNPSKRDIKETDLYDRFQGTGRLLLGICRGAQFLNCMNGGKLWQDVNGHGRDHTMRVLTTGDTITTTSTHHQMMRPAPTGHVLAVADVATFKYADTETWTSKGGVFFPDDHKDTEIVWYPTTNCLCIQGHPEYVPGSHFASFCLDLIVNYHKEAQSCVA